MVWFFNYFLYQGYLYYTKSVLKNNWILTTYHNYLRQKTRFWFYMLVDYLLIFVRLFSFDVFIMHHIWLAEGSIYVFLWTSVFHIHTVDSDKVGKILCSVFRPGEGLCQMMSQHKSFELFSYNSNMFFIKNFFFFYVL